MTIQLNQPSTTEGARLPDGSNDASLFKMLWTIFKPHEYLETMLNRYGDIYTDKFSGFPPLVVVSHPKAIQEIFTADPKLFMSGSGNQILQPLIGANSLILQDGDRHRQQRKLLMPPFHGERMKTYGQIIGDVTRQVMNQRTSTRQFLARPAMQEISLKIILQAVFGLKEGERCEQIQQLLISLLDFFNYPVNASFLFFKSLQRDLGAWSPWGRFLRIREQLDLLLYQEIRDRRAKGDFSGEDILSLLLSARDESGQPMTEVELRDELMTMLFAGHETTALALSWALYWIHYIPEVREKLLQELNSINAAEADPTEIARLPYLNAVCSETLRIYPVALFAFSRTLQAPMELMGYKLPPGTALSICIYLTHQRPDLYPEPKRFNPERFLERQFSQYEYLPFGGGNRRCLGMAFALFEMKLVLVTILSHYSLTLAEKRPVLPVRRGLVFAPAGGVRLCLEN